MELKGGDTLEDPTIRDIKDSIDYRKRQSRQLVRRPTANWGHDTAPAVTFDMSGYW